MNQAKPPKIGYVKRIIKTTVKNVSNHGNPVSKLTTISPPQVLVPFAWLAIPLTLPNLADRIAFRTYLEEAVTFDFLALFLGISFLVLVLTFTLLTLRNNRRFKRLLQKQSMHDEVALEKRKEVLEAFYEERFGTKEERHAAKYYAVAPEQNIGETEIQELFRIR